MGYFIIPLLGLVAFFVVLIYQKILISALEPLLKLSLFLVFTFFLMVAAYLRVQSTEEGTFETAILSPLAAPINKGIETYRQITKSKELEKIVNETIQGEEGTYAVAIKNMKTGEEYNLNETRKFDSASLYKLWVMATTFQQIEEGRLSLDQKIGEDIATLNKKFDIDEANAEISEGAIEYTVKDALEQMITISHNYAALLLTANVRLSNVKQFLLSNQLTASSTGSPPQTTADDTLDFYSKLYSKQLISQNASAQMLEILKRQKLNDRIPKYLPEETKVAHKTGELDRVKHDAGIVFTQKGDYIIVLMSQTPEPLHAAEVEAQISKKVWEYFNK